MAKSVRDVYGEALLKYGKENKNIVALDADVSGSTKSCEFGKAFPERFFNVGIAEANMVAMAAGLSTTGKIPFVNTFAVFLITAGLLPTRGLISYTNLNVKLMGAYGGLSDAFDGPSHHSIEDIAVMRALPNMKVFVASDAAQVDFLIKNAVEKNGPMYIRLSRDAMEEKYDSNTSFEEGKGIIVKDGKDATIIACGMMVDKAIDAANLLDKKGISVRVVDMFSIKPIDEDIIIKCAKETGAIITAEEHSIIGGLGGAVAEVMASNGCSAKLDRVGLNDCFAETGPYKKLFEKYGLDGNGIATKVEKSVSNKNK